MPTLPNVLRVTIEHDSDVTNPAEEEGSWTVYTFGRCGNGIITDTERTRFFDEETGEPDEELAHKLALGLAFGVRYSEHGPMSSYDLASDTESGLVVWDNAEDEIGGKTVEERQKDAESFLEEYTEWANGNCHWFKVERIKSVAPDFDPEDGDFNGAFWEEVETLGGFIGEDGITECIEEVIARYPGAKVAFEGDGAWIMN